MNSIKSNAKKAVILIALFIPLLMSGRYIYNHFSNISSDRQGDLDASSVLEQNADNEVNTADNMASDEKTDAEKTDLPSSEDRDEGNKVETDAQQTVEDGEDETPATAVIDNGDTIEKVELSKEMYSDADIKLLQETYQTLYFESQSFKISNGNAQELDAFIKIANRYPDEPISIEGHANGYPNFENSIMEQAVSSDRSHAVESYFLENGIDENRMTLYNCGSSQPLALDEENQNLNDRIEIYFRDYNAKGNKDK